MRDIRTLVFVQQLRKHGKVGHLIATPELVGGYAVMSSLNGFDIDTFETKEVADDAYHQELAMIVQAGWMRDGEPYLSSVKALPPGMEIHADWLVMTVLPIVRRGPRGSLAIHL